MPNMANSLTAQLGQTIRHKRKALGLTQEQLADMIGVGHQALSRIEHGKIAPKLERLPLLARSLQCSIPDLFRDEASRTFQHNAHITELLQGLPPEKQEFIVAHISRLVALLRS